jgi:hypothetical protein
MLLACCLHCVTLCVVYSNGVCALSCVWCTVMAFVHYLCMVFSSADGALSCVWCTVAVIVHYLVYGVQ